MSQPSQSEGARSAQRPQREVIEIDATPDDVMPDDASESSIDDAALEKSIEALILSTDRPLSEARLGELLDLSGKGAAKTIRAAVDRLNDVYDQSGRAFRLERLAGGWQLMTRAEHGPLLAKLHGERQSTRLSQAALETLAIIAYRQPIMRAEIEAIRGVACGEVLRGLLERRLVRIAGRAEELGRPMLYGTTSEFLKVFGLAGLDDLPPVQGADPTARRRPAAAPEVVFEAASADSVDAARDVDAVTPSDDAPASG